MKTLTRTAGARSTATILQAALSSERRPWTSNSSPRAADVDLDRLDA
jgi:hypothetical protein